ncbi:DUF1080 domain-containing protein [Roseimicrobium sp. ORNL1]|uniref:3-keto-disaccharide hydrolase n=1 Tax=Roseimicrobium sp. ORNL1 TaxID=2711231 RepID=UPI0013E13318|nr:DUF1080 domain-containing protein [Roseimicrobium sp. ORNL1]QIF00749.1 DUF1080 domain-containing protein [Roseimicrobium sp. ORNL1]
MLGIACIGFISGVTYAQAPSPTAEAKKPNEKEKEKRMTPDGKWEVHSMTRPKPSVVEPKYDGQPVPPPQGAKVLFNGKDLSQWKGSPRKDSPDQSEAPKWKVQDGYAEIVGRAGSLKSKETIKGDVHLHIEWATPAEIVGKGQGRGNSGVYLGGFPEIQVLDSYENETYADGQAAALYGNYPPAVNASKKPGEWQSYDIIAERAKVENGKVVRKARLTVKHNGVVVHDKVELDTRTMEGDITLQDHLNPVRYRNIWVLPLKNDEPKS